MPGSAWVPLLKLDNTGPIVSESNIHFTVVKMHFTPPQQNSNCIYLLVDMADRPGLAWPREWS